MNHLGLQSKLSEEIICTELTSFMEAACSYDRQVNCSQVCRSLCVHWQKCMKYGLTVFTLCISFLFRANLWSWGI